MERIRTRSMPRYVLGLFLNLGIGLVFGLIFGIIAGTTYQDSAVSMAAAELYYGTAEGLVYALGLYDISLTGQVILGGMLYWALLGLVTANLYALIFNYRLALDINAVCEGDGQESESYLVAVLLCIVTLGIYNLFWTYKLAKRLRANTPRYGFKMPETGKEILALHLTSFGTISTYELIKNLNRVAQVYNQSGPAAVVGGVQ